MYKRQAQDVRDAGDAEPGQLLDQLVVKTKLFLEVGLAVLGIEQAEQTLGVFVVDVDDHVGVLHIVNPGNEMCIRDSS